MLTAARVDNMDTETGTSPARPDATPTTSGSRTPGTSTVLTPTAPSRPISPTRTPSPVVPVSQTFPPGSITAYSKKRGRWRIAIPKPAGKPAGLPATSQGTATPINPKPGLFYGSYFGAAYVQVAESGTKPSGVKEVDEKSFDSMTAESTSIAVTTQSKPPVQPFPKPGGGGVGPGGMGPPGQRLKNCIARFNTTRKVYSIYCPKNASSFTPAAAHHSYVDSQPTASGSVAVAPAAFGLADENFRCLYGNCLGDPVTPPVPAGYAKEGTSPTQPNEGESDGGQEKDKFLNVHNPWMWVAIGGAAVVIGGGAFLVIRRRR